MLAVCLALIDDENDKKAFEAMVDKYERKLYHEAYKILKTHDLAENAVWETFYRIANCFQKVNNLPVYKKEAYLIITIRNASYRIYNIEKKHSEAERYEAFDELPNFDDFFNSDSAALAEALDELDEKCRTAVVYFYYYGHSANEIAGIMNVSRTSVYKYLNKAKRLLSEKLGGDTE